MKLKYISCFISLFCLFISTTGQITKLDSLRRLISTEKDENRKTDLLLMLSIEFRQINPDSSRLISDRILQISDKRNDADLRLKAELNNVYYFINSTKPDSGFSITEKNIKELKQKGSNDSLLSQYQSASGFSLMKMNRQKEALERFYASLKIAEIIGDKKAQAKALHQIGWAQMELNQYAAAIAHFKSSLNIFTTNKIPYLYPATFTNLASCYGALGKLDSVTYYAKKGIDLANAQNNYSIEANGWFILGTGYMEQKNYDEALKCFLKAKPIREKTGDYFFIVSDMAVIGELYALMGNTDSGIKISKDALQVAKQQNMQAKFPMIYKSLALNYEKAGDYTNASLIYKKINELKDSIYTNASTEALAEMEARYETEKKERIILEQQFNL